MKTSTVFRRVGLSIALLALIGCTKAEDTSSVSIRFPGPPTENRSASLQSVSPFSSSVHGWDSSDPTSLSELGCFAVFVSGPEQELRGSVCHNLAGSEIIRFGKVAGLFGRGQSATIEIKPGYSRRILVVGMKLINGQCETNLSGLTEANYSYPFLIGASDSFDLAPSTTRDVVVTAVEKFNNDNKIGDCTFLPGSGGGGGGGGTTPIRLTVEPFYGNGVNWNDYVKYLGPSVDTAEPCTGSETGSKACVHGGEKRKVTVDGHSSCADLSAHDNLAAFKWSCQVMNGKAVFVSMGFQEKKGLGDLLTASSFKSNHVTVKKGATVIGESAAAVWWNNTVKPVPDNSSMASAALGLSQASGETNTIFTVSRTIATTGYNLQSDKTSLVVLPGAKLQFSGASQSSCNIANGALATSSGARCLIAAGGKKFLWIEGALEGAGSPKSDYGVFLYGARFSRLHLLKTSQHAMNGVHLQSSSSNTLTMMESFKNTANGIFVADSNDNAVQSAYLYSNMTNGFRAEEVSPSTSSHRNMFHKIVSANNGTNGFSIHRGDFNVVNGLKAYNNGAKGADIGGNSQVLTQVLVFGNAAVGLNLWGSRSNASFVTAVNNKGTGIALTTNASPTGSFSLSQFYSVSNGFYDGTYDYFGLHILGHADSRISHGLVGKGSHSSASIRLENVMNLKFTGALLVEGGCDLAGSNTSPGLDATCTKSGSSTATKITVNSPASALVGRVTSDSSNLSGGATGIAAQHDLMDWFNFQSPLRGFGVTGEPATSSADRGRCIPGANCQIWDFRIKASDTLVLNKSGDGTTNSGAFAAGVACPASVDGDSYRDDLVQMTYSPGTIAINNAAAGTACGSGDSACFNRYLVNAVEITGDDIGDEDGLCESGEACIYAPNFGAYQGDGALTGTCVFQNSATIGVRDVKMYGYESNGI